MTAALRIADREHAGGQLDQERLQRPAIPVGKHLGERIRCEAAGALQHVVRFGDELHVGVLDAVVHHLHEMPGAVGADVRHARSGIGLRRNRFEDRRERGVGFLGAARHDRRTVARAVFAARDAGAHEPQASGGVGLFAPLRVLVPGVAAVDDDVAGVEQRLQIGHHLIDGRARLDHHQDLARALEAADQILQARGGDHLAAAFCDRRGGERGIAVEHRDREPVVGDVEGQVAAHHRHANHADLGGCLTCHGRCPARYPCRESRGSLLPWVPTCPPRTTAPSAGAG